ncbi:unnamed protein product [Didymodactylos carnosus]|uniref:Superoxide dismutase [Cu-Zn] n=1 Tax=Didymodactylos carnosus TaxID=1234261 RepID=A0A8S2DT26_9BILA|nr:unnamed protein product [Didymodactylos carnosus]CAF3740119.1 unnamed protein product [Didymodactylos carnosus]
MLLVSTIFLFSVIFLINGQELSYPLYARANVHLSDSKTSIGTLYFIQGQRSSPVIIRGNLAGLIPNTTYHGFHVHTSKVDDQRPNCTAANAHFNPFNRTHGAPVSTIDHRHVGDLGNIYADGSGKAAIFIADTIIRLNRPTGQRSILNRTIIVHKDIDDLGLGGQNDSLTTGHAGARLACGHILSTTMTENQAFKTFLF